MAPFHQSLKVLRGPALHFAGLDSLLDHPHPRRLETQAAEAAFEHPPDISQAD
jgi:hypothetical protein